MTTRRNMIKQSLLGTAGLSASAFLTCEKTEQNDCITTIMTRRSVRQYTDDPVPEKDLIQILDAARMAPTAGNQQPWKFIVVQKPEIIQRLKAACIENSTNNFKKSEEHTEEEIESQKHGATNYYSNVFSAPVYVVVLTDSKSRRAGYNRHDGPLAAGTLCLAARALGYGTVYYTASIPEHVTQKVLNIPKQYQRVCVTPIGKPVKWPDCPPKKKLENFIVYDSFGQ